MEPETQQERAQNEGVSTIAELGAPAPHFTVIELAPLAIGANHAPARKVTLTCELPEAIAEQVKPGMSWNGKNWLTAQGEPVEIRELSTA